MEDRLSTLESKHGGVGAAHVRTATEQDRRDRFDVRPHQARAMPRKQTNQSAPDDHHNEQQWQRPDKEQGNTSGLDHVSP